MDRLQLTPEQQTYLDSERANANAQVGDPVVEGTNLVVDDHLQVDNSWNCILVGGASGDAPVIYVPDWGDFTMPCALLPYVTDRAGPNNETMPIYDEPEEPPPEMMMASAEGAANPRKAAKAERRSDKSLRQALRDGVASIQDEKQRNQLRDAMKRAGVLGGNDPKGAA